MKRHILAISGGGFSEEDQAFIDEYLLKIPRNKEKLKIAFVPTASHDDENYINKFYKAFERENPMHLTVNDMISFGIQNQVKSLDIIYVGGGDTRHMVETWKKTGFDKVLINAYQEGVILAGISAGAMCWFDTCFSLKQEEEFEVFNGIGILNGCLCPHYNDENVRRVFNKWSKSHQLRPLYALEDNENLHFINEKLVAKITT